MKITLERAALLKVLGHVQSVVERRNTIPILSNVMIVAENGTVTMTATDLDLQATETVPAEIETPGRTTVAAHTFHDIIRKMPDGAQIQISVAERMTVTGGRARFTLPILPIDDFPIIAPGDLPNQFNISAEVLSRLLAGARFAMSTEETRYYLNGIFLHTVDDSLFAVATDGHRLARMRTDRPEGAQDIEGIIIPRKCVGEILKVIDDVEGDVLISLSGSKIRFDMGDLNYVSKLVDGTYPDYNRVIPTANTKIAVVDARTLAETIDRVATIATERTRAVKVDLEPGKLTLSVTSTETGLAVEEVSIDYNGPPLEIGFNARYFIDILVQNRDDPIEISFDDPVAPVLLRPKNDSGALCVLMPMRT